MDELFKTVPRLLYFTKRYLKNLYPVSLTFRFYFHQFPTILLTIWYPTVLSPFFLYFCTSTFLVSRLPGVPFVLVPVSPVFDIFIRLLLPLLLFQYFLVSLLLSISAVPFLWIVNVLTSEVPSVGFIIFFNVFFGITKLFWNAFTFLSTCMYNFFKYHTVLFDCF